MVTGRSATSSNRASGAATFTEIYGRLVLKKNCHANVRVATVSIHLQWLHSVTYVHTYAHVTSTCAEHVMYRKVVKNFVGWKIS